MSLFGDITGFIDQGRASNSISNANIAAEHGVLGAATTGQEGIASALSTGATNVNAAGKQAIQTVNDATGTANNTLAGVLGAETSNLNPYLQAGQQGANQLASYAGSNPNFSFNPGDLTKDPGYQFQLDQGTSAITNQAAASGLAQGGNTLKALTQFGQGLAGTTYNNAFQRAKQQFDTNQNATLANLAALTNTGQVATQQFQQASQNAGNQTAANTINAGMYAGQTDTSLQQFLASLGLTGSIVSGQMGATAAKQAGDFAVGAGTAHAAGIINQGAALTSGIGDLVSAIPKGLVGLIPGGQTIGTLLGAH